MTYYTLKEAAEMLRMNPEVVRKAISDQKLGAFRKGGGKGPYLLTQKHIDAYLVPAGAEWAKQRNK